MSKRDSRVKFRFNVLQYAKEHKNITLACHCFKISRTTYYKWYNRYRELGYQGLYDKEKSKPKMPNQIKPENEALILQHVIRNPKYGPRKISDKLKEQGIHISETGVYHVLQRNKLNRQKKRQLFSLEKTRTPESIKI